jgi:glutathionylspermidine synthase
VSSVSLEPLPASAYPAYRREAIFAACKWDPQIGDVNVLCDHALVLDRGTASWLARQAELLSAETVALEGEFLRHPEVHRKLGLGWRLRRALARVGGEYPAGVRLMRFDFHPTDRGWIVSEVNSDVPGGFGEAAVLPRLAASLLDGVEPAGPDPAAAVADAFAARLPERGRVALVHATAYSDDRQVMEFLGNAFRERGFEALPMSPDHLRWDGADRAKSTAEGAAGEVHGVFRFFPAEWLPNLSGPWDDWFRPGPPACNHPAAILCQSKRAPAVWESMGLILPVWESLLMDTVDPRHANWLRHADWVLKPAFGRVGEDVAVREVLEPAEWKRIRKDARRHPGAWVAQRRFESRAADTRDGERHVCVGVYTVECRAAGFYARVSARPRIDQFAQDAPVLVSRRSA